MDMPVLDVAIGMIFLYLLLSLIVTTLQESIASLLRWRSENLYNAIANLLEDKELPGEWQSLAIDVYRHPLVAKLCRGELGAENDTKSFGLKNSRRLPSYLPSRTFAIALLDVLRKKSSALDASGASTVLANARGVVDALPPGGLKSSLILLVDDADALGATVEARAQVVSTRVEQWFNDSMTRAAGWYKRKAQAWSLGLGLGLAVLLNANSFEVASRLWTDRTLRATVVANAQAFHERSAKPPGEATPPPELPAKLKTQLAELGSLPIGWTRPKWDEFAASDGSGLLKVFGWLATALAVSLGATFWFDVLGRALQIRGSGGKISAATGKPDEKG